METYSPAAAPIRSALFVDFDNIYIGLSKSDPQAAERFASDPARWLAWLETGMPVRGNQPPRPRSILIRRCYPNPDAGFRRFRSFFTSAAFSVIDCPSMTRTGKNSADIYMVMDMLDMLNHKTNFDEFLILSGDSDFMPVLLRLRAHDRRTTTLAIDFMPPAFKAACDMVISEEEFIEEGLGIRQEEGAFAGSARVRIPLPLLKSMAARVAQACAENEVEGADLPDILKDFREFRDSTNWLGFGTSQRLAEAMASYETRLQVIRLSPMTYKLNLGPSVPVSTSPRSTSSASERVPVPGKAVVIQRPAHPAARPAHLVTMKPEQMDLPALRKKVIGAVKEIVAKSTEPVLLARASQAVMSLLGAQVKDTQWAGAGSFKRLLQGDNDLGLVITTVPEPGYIYDASRHTPPGKADESLVSDPLSERAPLDQKEAPAFEGEDLQPIPAPTEAAAPPADDVTMEESTAALTMFGAPEVVPAAADEDATDAGVLYDVFPVSGMEESAIAVKDMQDRAVNIYSGEHDLNGDDPDLADETEDEDAEDEEEFEETLPSPEEFARRVSQVTGAPDLTAEQYALIFRGIVVELQEIAVGEKAYNTYQSSKSVSEWCAEQGHIISRADVVSIFKGIIFQDGVRFGKRPGSYTAPELAAVVCGNIKALCRRSRMELSVDEERLLEDWICGGFAENAV